MQRAAVAARNANPLLYGGVFFVLLVVVIYFSGVLEESPISKKASQSKMRSAAVAASNGEGDEVVVVPPSEPAREAPKKQQEAPEPSTEAAVKPAAPSYDPTRKRIVVLHSADGRINTGVWPSWGGDPPTTATLNWGTAGVVVEKSCPVQCAFLHDNSAIGDADAVVSELLNWPKFGLSGDFPVPERTRDNPRAGVWSELLRGPAPPRLPVLGIFGYEPKDYFPQYGLANSALASQFDFSMTYQASTTLPISLVCPWGRKVSEYLAPPPPKTPGHTLAYFSEHGASPSMRKFVEELFQAAGADGIHAYVHMKNRELPPEAVGEPFALSNRMAFVGTYRFLFITEQVEEPDFLSPEFSQALSMGTVPVYLGIPNIAEYAPPGGWVDARAFATGGELWDYLSSFKEEGADAAYGEFFAWKAGAAEAEKLDGGGVPGTGDGLKHDACSGNIMEEVKSWPRPAPPGSERFNSGGKFQDLAVTGWRCFKKHLDQCVHYSECRVCRLVHQVT